MCPLQSLVFNTGTFDVTLLSRSRPSIENMRSFGPWKCTDHCLFRLYLSVLSPSHDCDDVAVFSSNRINRLFHACRPQWGRPPTESRDSHKTMAFSYLPRSCPTEVYLTKRRSVLSRRVKWPANVPIEPNGWGGIRRGNEILGANPEGSKLSQKAARSFRLLTFVGEGGIHMTAHQCVECACIWFWKLSCLITTNYVNYEAVRLFRI